MRWETVFLLKSKELIAMINFVTSLAEGMNLRLLFTVEIENF
jgi:hypothetical protein